MGENFFELEFTCKHIIYRGENNNFVVFDAKILSIPDTENFSRKNVTIKGNFERIEEKDSFRCYAVWVDDKKYGRQIEAQMPVMIASSDVEGIKRFLCRFIKGIGKGTATKIVDKYGTSALDKIKESPDNISCIKGISKEKAKKMHEELLKNDNIEKLSIFLFRNGVSSFMDVVNIYDKMGDDAQDKISANPYSICDYLSISKLPLADKIALKMNFSPVSEIRIAKIIQHYLYSHGYSSGDMYMSVDYLFKTLFSYMAKCNFYRVPFDKDKFFEILKYMQTVGLAVIEEINEEKVIFLKPFYTIEFNTANIIKKINVRRCSPLKPEIYDKFFEKYIQKTGFEADEIQKSAVKIAYENRLSLLTGGPGTGKTQTINAIISFIEKEKPSAKILLCSPTGRASKRMSELTGREAYTIHRLLGITGEDEYGNSYLNELDADFVICDEASMIDSALFYKLITAVSDNKNTSLLLVGDKDQLPPVGVGLPFKDMIESGVIPTVKLEKLFRQAGQSQINRNAKLILKGVTSFGENGLTFDKSKQDFFFFNTQDVEFQKTLIINSMMQISALNTSFDDMIVLSPTRKGPLGVVEINKYIQSFINPLDNRVEFKGANYNLRVNDRVMQTYNDYELGVFNGDIGVVTSIDTEDEEIVVTYDDVVYSNGLVKTYKRDVVYSYTLANTLELAYSTTVHKAQGSEFPVVIFLLSPDFYNLSRNILYTGVTRAKKRCIFIGDADSLIKGIQKDDNTQRRTLLKERIK